MSYDIDLTISTGGDEMCSVYDWNYTSNCARMWREAGADLAEFDGKTARECEPILTDAIYEMSTNPAKFEAMNPPNGWGSYDSVLKALTKLRGAMLAHPATTVRVSR